MKTWAAPMMKTVNRMIAASALGLSLTAIAACEDDDGAIENAGEQVQDAADDTKDAVDDAID